MLGIGELAPAVLDEEADPAEEERKVLPNGNRHLPPQNDHADQIHQATRPRVAPPDLRLHLWSPLGNFSRLQGHERKEEIL